METFIVNPNDFKAVFEEASKNILHHLPQTLSQLNIENEINIDCIAAIIKSMNRSIQNRYKIKRGVNNIHLDMVDVFHLEGILYKKKYTDIFRSLFYTPLKQYYHVEVRSIPEKGEIIFKLPPPHIIFTLQKLARSKIERM